jgi:hypothetical protein
MAKTLPTGQPILHLPEPTAAVTIAPGALRPAVPNHPRRQGKTD